MKKLLLRSMMAAGIVSIGLSEVNAQGYANQLVVAGKADAEKLIGAYMSPALKAFGADLNAGWFNTAKPHGLGGFDITFATNLAFAPASDQNFDMTTIGLTNVRPTYADQKIAPTVFGADNKKTLATFEARNPITNQMEPVDTFPVGPGLGVNFFPFPTVQFSVGVGLGTEVAIRYFPQSNFNGVEVGLIGGAVKHDIKQWIPGIKALPFDLSAMFGFTSMNTRYVFPDDDQQQAEADADTYNPNPGKKYDDQRLEYKSFAWTANVLISKKLAFFTPYLGLGYQYASTDMGVLGTYPVVIFNEQVATTGDPSFGKTKRIIEVTDFADINGTFNAFRATAGFRLKLAILTIHADYTFSKYNVASVGLGINVQSLVPPKL